MKILLVSSSILPQTGGSSVIVENLAKNFKKQEMLVYGSASFLQQNNFKRDPKGPKFIYFFSELSFFGRGARFFDWFRKIRLNPLIEKLKDTIRKENITHVIGVYPNAFYCLAACRAAKEENVAFSSYFHNTYVENTAITDANAGVIQDEIFQASKNIFVMSKGMQQYYEQKYKLDSFIPLVHSFDEFPSVTPDKSSKEKKDHYKLVAIGNFNESNLDATKRLLKAIKGNDKYSLSVYTHVPKLLLQKRGIDTSQINYMGSVSPDEIHGVLQDHDICVLTHGFKGGYGEVEYQTIFPTRTIPFLLSGKPIFAHSPKKSFLNTFIQEHKCADLADRESTEDILIGLENISNNSNYQNELIENAKKAAKQFYGPNVSKLMIEQVKANR
ncbi:MAG: hypothetical protein JKY48_01660 [Flavobacteriales bacterium]|nr:hypothetical protein [Flavobacteriales bacterium]